MNITLQEAEEIVLQNLPTGASVVGRAEYEGMYLFLAPFPDPDEGHLDPFFSVDPNTGAFRDFSPQDYNNPGELLNILNPPTPEVPDE